jgi:hypothetical protein
MKFTSHLTNNITCELQNINMNGYKYRHIINDNDGVAETVKESRRCTYITTERRTAGSKNK